MRGRAHWPFHSSGWWPPPQFAHHAIANVSVTCTQCRTCGQQRLDFRANRDLTPGVLLCIAPCDQQFFSCRIHAGSLEVTFDGSIMQAEDGLTAAGAAAVASVPATAGEEHSIVARLAVSLPTVAKAWGARLAIELLERVLQQGTSTGRARIGGDNPPIVRACKGTGTLSQTEAHIPLVAPLACVATSCVPIDWVIIPRRVNKAAHGCARAAARQQFHFWVTGARAQTFSIVTARDGRSLSPPSASRSFCPSILLHLVLVGGLQART